LQEKSNPFPHFCHSSSCLPPSNWHWRNNVPNLPNSTKGGRNPLALSPKILPASTTDNTLPESFVDNRIEFPQPTGHHRCEVQLPFFWRNGTCLPRFLMNIWCLNLRTLQAKMGGTHSSFRNDDFPSLDYLAPDPRPLKCGELMAKQPIHIWVPFLAFVWPKLANSKAEQNLELGISWTEGMQHFLEPSLLSFSRKQIATT
jgi:hypothetical protein